MLIIITKYLGEIAMYWTKPTGALLVLILLCLCSCEKNFSEPTAPNELPTGLIITSEPAGAIIKLNNENTGAITPDTLTDIAPGIYQIRLQLTNHFPWDDTLAVAEQQLITITANLAAAPPYKIAYGKNDSLWVVGLDGLNPQLFAEDFVASRISWSPDGNYLAYSRIGGCIAILNQDGSLEAELTFGYGDRAADFSWSHNSQFLVNGSYTEGVYRYNTAADALELIYNTSGFTYDHNPVYSPADTLIAYVHHEYGGCAWIKLMSAYGTNSHTIIDSLGTSYDEWLDLAWLSDNETLFKIGTQGLYHLTMGLPPDTTITLTQVFEGNVSKLRVSPDRTKYAIYSDYYGLQLGLIGNWVPEISYIYNTSDFTWSPDSNALLITNSAGIYWAGVDGTTYLIATYNNPSGGSCISIAP